MDWILFSKMFAKLSVEELAAKVKQFGLRGVDLAVRPGNPVNPENLKTELKRAVNVFQAAGLKIPMITAVTNLTDAASDQATKLFWACADAGVPNIKIGYYLFDPKRPFGEQLDKARSQLDGFAKVARGSGVRACVHTHSGMYLAPNAGTLRQLLAGFDPKELGAYLDPGHLSVAGEPLPLAFGLVKEQLALVAVKDLAKVGKGAGSTRAIEVQVTPIGQGQVDWVALKEAFTQVGYNGPCSLHCEYETISGTALDSQVLADIAYLKSVGLMG
ncbi:MAG TPA: sugar phosphate isomerase/epimerase family protein [Planctomycetota bacterium]|nr:sugar phosphate isomerase/epimerase family protein [Planctomycetota bacterium]